MKDRKRKDQRFQQKLYKTSDQIKTAFLKGYEHVKFSFEPSSRLVLCLRNFSGNCSRRLVGVDVIASQTFPHALGDLDAKLRVFFRVDAVASRYDDIQEVMIDLSFDMPIPVSCELFKISGWLPLESGPPFYKWLLDAHCSHVSFSRTYAILDL